MINLVYWSEDNFGDALSPLLIEELSGKKTRLKGAYIRKFRRFIKGIVYLSPKVWSSILFPWQTNILGVGSIITCGNKRSRVWGSGFMNNTGTFNGGEIYAVRGPLTAKRLKEQGYPECKIFGDPALLLPLWIPAANKQYKVGLVPHWKESSEFISKYSDKYKVVDLRTKDVHGVVAEITSCDYILSTSLHGLIVAHAYGIPALWIKNDYIETDGFKFSDYFSSVGIAQYSGFEHIDQILDSEENSLALFSQNQEKTLVKLSLSRMQLDLLKNTPFSLKPRYQNMITNDKS